MFFEIPIVARPPCHKRGKEDCPDRRVGCQGTCKKYLAYRKVLDAAREERRKNSIGASVAADSIYRKRHSLKYTEAGRNALSQR